MIASPKLHIILLEPQIPQNTGNIGRMCAFADCRLHLIQPLGFELSDRYLKRSGMDYWNSIDLHIHENWAAFRSHPDTPERIWLMTTHGSRSLWDCGFQSGDGLLFGNEGSGCPDSIHQEFGGDRRIRIPAFNPSPLRSLNLSTAAGIATYEALRQCNHASL